MDCKVNKKVKYARIFLYLCLIGNLFLEVFDIISYGILVDVIIILLLFVLEKFPKT